MLNTFDQVGGAARAATRLRRGLRELGIDADLLVQFKAGEATDVVCSGSLLRKLARRLKLYLGMLPVLVYPNRPENNFSPALIPDRAPAAISRIIPNLIHLHWLCAGFLSVEALGRLDRPLVWTLHDSWPFTGGCHVPFDCTRYRQSCGACPVLGSSREKDLSRWTWNRKERAWRDLNLTVVAPSRWLADCASSSSLFRNLRVEVVPNGLETQVFRPRDREKSRKLLGLPQDRKIILFGAIRGLSDPNKGFPLLAQALHTLGKGSSDISVAFFSAFDGATMPDPGMPVIPFGRIDDDDRLATIYSAADVFVVPSLQEAFCQTAAEAMACGTPVADFGATCLLDVVDHRKSGYLAQPYDPADLARGIAWVLEDSDRHAELSFHARRKVEEEFSLDRVAERYASLYGELLEKRRGR